MKVCPQCDNPNTDARQHCLACGADLSQVEKQANPWEKAESEPNQAGKALSILKSGLLWFSSLAAFIGFFVGGNVPRIDRYDDFYWGLAFLCATAAFLSFYIPACFTIAATEADSSTHDRAGRNLSFLGTVLYFSAFFASVICFFIGITAPRTWSGDDFYWGTALLYAAVAFSSFFFPSLFIKGFSRVIHYLQQIAINTTPPQSKP